MKSTTCNQLAIIQSSIYNFIIFCDYATTLKKINLIFDIKKKMAFFAFFDQNSNDVVHIFSEGHKIYGS